MKVGAVLFALFCLVLVLVVVAAARHAHEDLVHSINSDPHSSWTADANLEYFGRFGGDDARVRRLLGLLPSDKRLPHVSPRERGIDMTIEEIPTTFDARDEWPGCIGAIRDQGECGSCWAVAGVEAISDRFCVQSNGQTNVTLAPLDPVTCDNNDDGCEGGDLASLWDYAQRSGVVEEACAPYNASIPTCPPAQQPCLNFVNTPACNKKCSDDTTWSVSKHFVKSAYNVRQNIADIQTEIMTNGPVEAGYTVYEDFLAYKTGVYKHTTGKVLGGHAVKIIGWGVDSSSNLPYWLIANSWTVYWGDNGFFKILRGSNECGIEDNIVAGLIKQ